MKRIILCMLLLMTMFFMWGCESSLHDVSLDVSTFESYTLIETEIEHEIDTYNLNVSIKPLDEVTFDVYTGEMTIYIRVIKQNENHMISKKITIDEKRDEYTVNIDENHVVFMDVISFTIDAIEGSAKVSKNIEVVSNTYEIPTLDTTEDIVIEDETHNTTLWIELYTKMNAFYDANQYDVQINDEQTLFFNQNPVQQRTYDTSISYQDNPYYVYQSSTSPLLGYEIRTLMIEESNSIQKYRIADIPDSQKKEVLLTQTFEVSQKPQLLHFNTLLNDDILVKKYDESKYLIEGQLKDFVMFLIPFQPIINYDFTGELGEYGVLKVYLMIHVDEAELSITSLFRFTQMSNEQMHVLLTTATIKKLSFDLIDIHNSELYELPSSNS